MNLKIPRETVVINRNFLHDAIWLVNEYYPYTKNYKEIAHAISVEFECECDEKDIENYFVDKNFELIEEVEQRLLYKNVTR